MKTMKPSEYYDELVRHDWYYEYSDDYSVWQRGQANKHRIQSIAQEDEVLLGLYNAYSDYMFREGDKPTRPED